MNIGGVTIKVPVMNAACSIAKTWDDVKAMCATSAGLVLIGSITTEQRDGNKEPRWFVGDDYALNSFGMPNGGYEFYSKELPGMVDYIHTSDKVAVLSIAGFSTSEYVQLAQLADRSCVDILELNLGCPNVSIDGKQKPIVSFDLSTMKEIVQAVQEVTKLPLAIKLSPYSNPGELKKVADLLTELEVAAVVASNTFPNGFVPNEQGESVLANEFAGVSGQAMMPISLGKVRQLRNVFLDSVAVNGVGGIQYTEDADMYYKAGAEVIQVATFIIKEGHQAIERIT